tara:strand:+ start:3744 stop:4301 length:558 start_codon:yes stop_codon:yes gene_type:complete
MMKTFYFLIFLMLAATVIAFGISQQAQSSHDNSLVEYDSDDYYIDYEEDSLSEQEQCLVETIYFEARGEPFLGQVAVGVVVMRRVQSPDYPNDICGVVHAGKYWEGNPVRNQCAFSYYCDGKSETMNNPDGFYTAQEAARLVLMGVVVDNMEEVVYYHATYVQPSWALHKQKAFQIGKHIFYKEK